MLQFHTPRHSRQPGKAVGALRDAGGIPQNTLRARAAWTVSVPPSRGGGERLCYIGGLFWEIRLRFKPSNSSSWLLRSSAQRIPTLRSMSPPHPLNLTLRLLLISVGATERAEVDFNLCAKLVSVTTV